MGMICIKIRHPCIYSQASQVPSLRADVASQCCSTQPRLSNHGTPQASPTLPNFSRHQPTGIGTLREPGAAADRCDAAGRQHPCIGANAATGASKILPTVTVTEKALAPEGKDTIRTTTSTIGKGNQQLRDIPQSVTVVTEKLIDDRNLDTLKDVLHNTAGITFLAAEGGEEDIRLRGFSLQATGDIFVDGMRDPAFYDRDTFNNDRIEVLRGSALHAVRPRLTPAAQSTRSASRPGPSIYEHEVTTTIGSHDYRRAHRRLQPAYRRKRRVAPQCHGHQGRQQRRRQQHRQIAASQPTTAGASARRTSSRPACTTWTTATA